MAKSQAGKIERMAKHEGLYTADSRDATSHTHYTHHTHTTHTLTPFGLDHLEKSEREIQPLLSYTQYLP